VKVLQWFISNPTPPAPPPSHKSYGETGLSGGGANTQGRLAQLVRAFDSHSKGRWFESTSDHIFLEFVLIF
jgi:hypothetical protein